MKISPCKFRAFCTFLYYTQRKTWLVFPHVIQSGPTLQGDISRSLQIFATRVYLFANFMIIFVAVVKGFIFLALPKI